MQAYEALLNIRYELDKARILADVSRRREKLKVRGWCRFGGLGGRGGCMLSWIRQMLAPLAASLEDLSGLLLRVQP